MLTRTMLLFLLLLGIGLFACTPAPGATQALPSSHPSAAPGLAASPTAPLETAVPTEFVQPDATPTLSVTPAPTVEPTPDLASLPYPQYDFEVELNYGLHHASVRQTILYTNRSVDTLENLMLMVEPAFYTGVFRLNRLAWDDSEGSGATALSDVENTTWEGTRLSFPLRQPLLSGQSVGLHLEYELLMPMHTPSDDARPIPFGYTVRQLNLVDWHPFIPPYRSGEGWLAHPQGYFGEHLVFDLADYTVRVRLLDERSDLLIAASSQEQVEGDWRLYRHERARNFALSVSHQYQVAQAVVGDTTVASYYFSFHSAAGRDVLDATVRSVELYNQLFGTYPRGWLSAVEADFMDGMEYDGLYFLSIGFYNSYGNKPADYLIAIATHETAHQWWYALVANDQALEPWLDEALCTYSERLYYENFAPEALDWWWTYRVNYYQPRGWVNTTIYDAGVYRNYRDAVYLNGAWFLEKLRTAMGDEAFFAFLKDYVQRNQGRIAVASDFLELAAQYSDADLSGLIGEYFSP